MASSERDRSGRSRGEQLVSLFQEVCKLIEFLSVTMLELSSLQIPPRSLHKRVAQASSLLPGMPYPLRGEVYKLKGRSGRAYRLMALF